MSGSYESQEEHNDFQETRRTIHDIREFSSEREEFIDDLEQWQQEVLLHQLVLNYEGLVGDDVVEELIENWLN